MKLFFAIIFAAVTVFGHSAFALSAVGPQSMSSAVDRPETRVGDSWTYRSRDGWTGLVQTEHTRVVIQVTNSQNVILVKNVSGAVGKMTETSEMNTTSQGTTRITPNTGQFVFPLFPGKTYVAKCEFKTKTGNNHASQEQDVTVVGWEEVTVPAGTFLALKIILKGYYDGAYGPLPIEVVRWYAPVVRRVVREDIKIRGDGVVNNWSIHELTAYNLAAD